MTVPKISGVRPLGTKVLMETLTAQEALGTKISIQGDAEVVGAPQAYILAVGDQVNERVKVGDRVIVTGNYTPVPNYDHSDRNRGLIDLVHVHAVLEEDS